MDRVSQVKRTEERLDLSLKISSRQAEIAVIGLGYVGMSLAVEFAEAGFPVTGIDVDSDRVAAVNMSESYLPDIPSDRLRAIVRGEGSEGTPGLLATDDYEAMERADVAVVCVHTPLSKTREPDLSHIIAATEQIASRLTSGMLVVLESTTYPGTTEEVILPRLQSSGGRSLEAGKDFFLAFSPERIDPGRTDWTVKNTPKVIGGVSPECIAMAKQLYESVVETVVPVSSPRVAEMVKMLENTFRATNVALVNEIAMICSHLGVDVWEVIAAAETKPFGYMPFYPGPGLGGHCLPVDPQYLAWKLKALNYTARFIQLADEINQGMPAYVVGIVSDALNQIGKPLKGSRILVLGVAYKADVADIRESPAVEVIELLRRKSAQVSYHDPYIGIVELADFSLSSTPLEKSVLKTSDCVVITTAHSSFDLEWVVENSSLVVDTRNATSSVSGANGRVVKL